MSEAGLTRLSGARGPTVKVAPSSHLWYSVGMAGLASIAEGQGGTMWHLAAGSKGQHPTGRVHPESEHSRRLRLKPQSFRAGLRN